MSNLDRTPPLTRAGGLTHVAPRPTHEIFPGREVRLGDTDVRRLLPNLGRRLVGAWCFIDHYGPDDIADSPGMQVPAHPHTGLQTVSWLLQGEVHHRDSLGSDQLIRPGELGLMTSGAAIAHAEESPVRHPALLHGVQLWVALPAASRETTPSWEHHEGLPELTDRGLRATVVLGSLAGAESPGTTYSPLVGADLEMAPGAEALLPLEGEFEHAVLALDGWAEVDGTRLEPGAMLYLGTARRELRLRSEPGARLLLVGGEPFGEQIVMWWNFVARSNEEIVAARDAWQDGARFGTVAGFETNTLAAPPLPAGRLKPGGSVRQ